MFEYTDNRVSSRKARFSPVSLDNHLSWRRGTGGAETWICSQPRHQQLLSRYASEQTCREVTDSLPSALDS